MAFNLSLRARRVSRWRRLLWPFPRTMLLVCLAALFYGPGWGFAEVFQTFGQYLVLFLALASVMDLELRSADAPPVSGGPSRRSPPLG